MKKICVVIRSKDYLSDTLPDLSGCEPDAVNIFEALTNPTIGAYDQNNSVHLVSPSLNQVRGCFDAVLQNNPDVDVFRFSFSGHGGVKSGSLFLCLNDTNVERLSTTALSLSEIFTYLAEIAPTQSNIIIDACESGGLVGNLRTLINPDLLGATDTPGVCIFAAAASDQDAKETPEGGFASSALVRCLRGEERVQSNRPYLNLIEVGNYVSNIVSNTAPDQTPVVWGLNLFGDSFLSNNPHFEGDAPAYSYGLAQIPAASEVGQILQSESPRLWQEYLKLPEHLNERRLVDAICQTCGKFPAGKGFVSSFIRGLSQSLPSHAAKQNDLFAEVQAYACCIVALLGFLNIDEEAEDTVLELTTQLSILLQSALEKSYEEMEKDRFAILRTRGGASDLYVVAIRISKILGWASANTYIRYGLKLNQDESKAISENIFRFVITNYLSSIVAISDCQSPFLLCAFSELNRNDYNDEAEILFGSVFNNYIESGGFIVDSKIDPRKKPEFLLRRNSGNWTGERQIYAQPDELLSVLLHVADKMKFEDVVDPFLEQIDHHSFNVFIPADHTGFGAVSVRNGVNATFTIGYEGGLGVFRTSDFRTGWANTCDPLLNAEPKKDSIGLKVMILLAAFLFPDRVPWLTFHAPEPP